MKKFIWLSAIIALCAALPAGQSLAQTRKSAKTAPQQSTIAMVAPHATKKRNVNSGTVTIIADTIGSTHTRMVADMVAVFNNGTDLRILPVLGLGGEQSITDILYLRGVDFSIVQSDVLSYIKQNRRFYDVANRVHYITKLHNQEFHVIARKDIRSLKDLEGRKVNFGPKGSGANITATNVFKAHGLNVKPTNFDEINAMDKLVLGEIAAMVYVAGKPAPLFAHVRADKNLHLLPVPYLSTMKEYLPAKFTSADYPGLVADGKAVPTVAVRAVLAVFNWRRGNIRYKKVVKFISEFFTRFHELRKPPRHPKWREVNIHAEVPGWNRFPPATEWVAKNAIQVAQRRKKLKPKASPQKRAFKAFVKQRVAANTSSNDRNMERLFEQFMQWRNAQARAKQR